MGSYKILISLFLISHCFKLHSQSSTPYREVELEIYDSVLIMDSAYIIPGSVQVKDSAHSLIKILVYQKTILLIQELHTSNHLKVSYTVLSSSPDLKIQGGDTTRYQVLHEIIPMSYKNQVTGSKPGKLPVQELEYAGAFGRGISFGNNQNLVLNSTLDLQLAGKLGDDMEISAAITDQNLPIQADGNTAQLNEIDKIFVQLKRKNQILLAGDQQLQPDQTYFLRYRKKYKGLQFTTTDSVARGVLKTSFGGAIARGNFKRQTLSITDGNQGPYRLTGSANELFVLVLSASEKVYLDGVLLSRGLENDYVMDYNRSEISFTAKRIINRNSRVVVEFEYSNQSYLKSAWSFQSRYQAKDLAIQWNSYQEGDNKNSNILQTLTDEDKLILREAGDQTSALRRTTIQSIDPTQESNAIRYSIHDTMVGNINYQNILSIHLRESPDDVTAQFNYVGPGAGNYIIENALFSNGRAYRWIAPDEITHQLRGEYEPSILLTAPKKQSQHSLKIDYKPLTGFYSSSEISLSNLNLNLYSKKDQTDNSGIAWKQSAGFNKKFIESTATWNNEITVENLSKTFSQFEPFRNPEFGRDWSLESTNTVYSGDLLTSFSSALLHPQYELGYKLQRYTKQNEYQGTHHGWNTRWNKGGTNLKFYGSALLNHTPDLEGKFYRPSFDFSQNLAPNGTQIIGIGFEKESNEQLNNADHFLTPRSFNFQTKRAYYKGSIPGRHLEYQLQFSRRTDKKINQDHFENHFYADEITVEQNWQINKNSNWSFRLGDRTLKYKSVQDPITDKNNHTLILRQSFTTRSSNNGIKYYETIESNSGQEPAIEYTYIKVNKGQGYYTWIDANKDSIIQVTEFELAPFVDQGEYIRYAVTGNDFVRTKNYLFLQNFELDGSKLGGPGTKRWYKKFGLISTINYSWKMSENNTGFLPFHLQDPSIISAQGQLRNQVYFNRGDPNFELQAGNYKSGTKWRLSTGFETRTNNELFIRSRQKINKTISLENYIANIHQVNTAELFKEKDYSIENFVLEPKINVQPGNSMRVSVSYKYKSGHESTAGTKTKLHEGKIETTVLPNSPWSIRSSFSSVWTSLIGKTNPLTEYNLLQGLRPGFNALIQLNVDRQINSSTILRLGYDGRKSDGNKYIQTGRAQVIASF
ncbi:MAG: hypothetical protein ABI761_01530 [Saprospiraceae bacterium]